MTPRVFMLAALLIAAPGPARAQDRLVDPAQMPGPLSEVRFDQQLGERLPLDTAFRDADGREVVLGDYFDQRPVVLVFVYYECPMLCSLILDGMAKALAVLQLEVGTDFDVVAISFDPGETPAMATAARTRTLSRYKRSATPRGWHFLTGTEQAIAAVTETAGFHFIYDPETDEYGHTSGILVVRPDGVINQYFYGVEYAPKHIRLALIDASAGRLGSLVDQLLLYCFRYDPQLGKYTAATLRVLRLTGAVFALSLVIFLWIMLRRDRASVRRPKPVGAAKA